MRRRIRYSRAIVGAGLAGLLFGVGGGPAPADEAVGFAQWASTARIAGAAVWTDMTQAEMENVVTTMAAQHVTVIEADSNLSNYLDESGFNAELDLMAAFAGVAHAHGIRVGWYYPTLEVLTPDGETIAQTMAKEHPDWVQRAFDGTPNVFYGSVVFWVDPGMESAWLSPSSPGYREYFLQRVRLIAGTGVDYLWGDVPLLNDIAVDWADTNPDSKAAFKAATGVDVPTAVDWTNPTWRRWVAWRHTEVRDFLIAVAEAGRAVNPDFRFIVETVTMDYGSTKIGLDGADLKSVPGVTQVWELDAISDAQAMRTALEDDWIRLIAMNEYARGASGDKPAWIFTYGKLADDAELVMAESIAVGNNPYETKIPQMATTVGADYRSTMFGWMKDNASVLDGTSSAARLAVLYSPESHDFVDQAKGQGLYATTTSSLGKFWSKDPEDSVYQRTYLAEYTGVVKALVNQHIPFDVIVRPTAQELARYQAVVAPDLQAASDAQAALLRQYVSAGGRLVTTGPNPTGLDAFGTARTEYALADVLGVTKATALPASTIHDFGAGEARVLGSRVGRTLLTGTAPAAAEARTALIAAVEASATPWLTTDADRRVHMDLRRTADGSALVLHMVNAIGVDGSYADAPTTSTTTLNVPEGYRVTAVESTAPQSPTRTALAFTSVGQLVTFAAPVTRYAVVVLTLEPGSPPANHSPIAADDQITTSQGVAATLTGSSLLANDTDPDGDPLTIGSVSATSAKGGTITGAYTYTPAAGFSGADSFEYVVADGRGGTDTGLVRVTVTPAAPVNQAPIAAADAWTAVAGTALAVPAPGILANDTDPDGDTLTVTGCTAAAHGALSAAVDGAITYTAVVGFVGDEVVTCTVSDGHQPASAALTIRVDAPPSDPGTPPASSPPAVVVPPQPAPVSPSIPVVAAPPSSSVRVKAVSGRSKLSVNVDPNLRSGSWRFRVQRLAADGTWVERSTTYRTKGKGETRTINLPKGTYRVRILAGHGRSEAVSAPATLRR